MRGETIRMIADELADATYGVNAVLPDVPRDTTDPQPPDIKAVYDASRHGWVRRGEIPDEMRAPVKCPFLVVTLPGEIDYGAQGRPTNAGGNAILAELSATIQYVTFESDTEDASLAGQITLRAARGVIQRLARPERATARRRNQVQLEKLEKVFGLDDVAPIEDKMVIAGLVVTTWSVREQSI